MSLLFIFSSYFIFFFQAVYGLVTMTLGSKNWLTIYSQYNAKKLHIHKTLPNYPHMRTLSRAVQRLLMRGACWVSRSGTLYRTIDCWYRFLSPSNKLKYNYFLNIEKLEHFLYNWTVTWWIHELMNIRLPHIKYLKKCSSTIWLSLTMK